MNPLVSVVTASYNHQRWLPYYFHGLLLQDYRPLQLIFVCDHSPDGTWTAAMQWAPKLLQAGIDVRMVNNEQNLGAFETFDKAFSMADGEIIATLESDDFYMPEKISKGVQFLKDRPHFAALHTEINSSWEDGRYEERSWEKLARNRSIETTLSSLIGDNSIYTCTFMMRREVMLKMPKYKLWKERGYKMADYPAVLWTARNYRIGYMDEALSTYRVLPNSASHAPETYHEFVASYLQIKQDAAAGKI